MVVELRSRHVFSPFGGGIPEHPKWGQSIEIFGSFGLSESRLTANVSKTISHIIHYVLIRT